MLEPNELEMRDAQRVGRYVARSWPNVDAEDVVAELLLWLCQNGKHLERWREEGAHGSNKLRVALAREARKYARKEHNVVTGSQGRAEDSGYEVYEVEAVLRYIFDNEDWAAVGQYSTGPLAALADISGALNGMSKDDRKILFLRYGQDKAFREVGDLLECSEDAARMRNERALTRLRQRLSGEGAQWDGSRNVVSNARAQAITRTQDV